MLQIVCPWKCYVQGNRNSKLITDLIKTVEENREYTDNLELQETSQVIQNIYHIKPELQYISETIGNFNLSS